MYALNQGFRNFFGGRAQMGFRKWGRIRFKNHSLFNYVRITKGGTIRRTLCLGQRLCVRLKVIMPDVRGGGSRSEGEAVDTILSYIIPSIPIKNHGCQIRLTPPPQKNTNRNPLKKILKSLPGSLGICQNIKGTPPPDCDRSSNKKNRIKMV